MFRRLVNEPRFAKIPVNLETAKVTQPDEGDMDVVNFAPLRSLLLL